MLILLHLLMANDLFAADVDGDGVDSSIDCDDSNVSIGEPTTYYMDSDGDSYGDSSDAGFSTCANVSSMSQLVTNNNDCDDSNANAFPGAAPNDSMSSCMVDNDGDGFGDSNVSAVSCYAIELFDMSISGDILTVSTSNASYNYGSGSGIYSVRDVCFDSTSISFQTTSSLDPTQSYVSVSNLLDGSELGYSNTASDTFLSVTAPAAGTDCDDSDSSSLSTLFDADCDGYLAHADCDPDDAAYNVDCSGQSGGGGGSSNNNGGGDSSNNNGGGDSNNNGGGGSSNTAPIINSVSISPSIVYTDTTITANASATDADGDNVTLAYSWSVDGVVVQNGVSNTLDGSVHFDKDQSVSVSVTPNDGTDDGTPVSSNAVSISNSVPSTPIVSVSPTSPTAGQDDLVCSATASDDDGDALTFTYSWEDGQGTVVSSVDTVTGSTTSAGNYTCYVSVDDGSGSGGSSSASVSVAAGSNVASVSQSTLSAGELRISEMHINPLNPNSSTIFSKGEWFEIYNTTSDLVNLNGLVVSDYLGQTFTVSSDVYVEATGYVTLGLSNDQTNNGGISHDYEYGSDFRFGNADAVIITSSSGIELDEVNYSIVEDSWSDGQSDSDSTKGASLSLIDFSIDLDSAGSGNTLDDGRYWVESNSSFGDGTNFGTPGQANDVYDFDGDGFTAADGDCNVIDSSIYPGATEDFTDNIDQDCDGIANVPETTVSAGDIIFSEIMHAPSGTLRYQAYVELYNTTSNTVNLKNFVLGGTDNVEGYTIPSDLLIGPNEYVYLIARTSSSRNGGLSDFDAGFTYGSSSGRFEPKVWADTVVLKDSSGNTVDSVTYNSASFPTERGASLSFPPEVLDATLNDSADAWCLTTDTYGDGANRGSPGTATANCTTTTHLSLADQDGDGLTLNNGDCDDTDANSTTTSTDADCDGIETASDCDDTDASVGTTLNGQAMTSYYTDSDSDGFGDSAASAEMSCAAVTGKVTNNSDCNDSDESTYPGAGFSETGSLSTACVTDFDTDGYASQNPASGALAGTDCNDNVSGAFPSNTNFEFCDFEGTSEFVDYNCNGSEANNPTRCSLSSNSDLIINGTLGETLGSGTVRQIDDISGDGIADIVVTAHTFGSNHGKLYFFEGPISSNDQSPYLTISGEDSGDYLGFQDVSVGDVNGDGEDDIVVSSHTNSGSLGRVYIFSGPHSGGAVDLSQGVDASVSTITGNGIYSNLGWEAEVIGDVDGDNIDDLALVSRKVNNKKDGALHIITGGNSLFASGADYLIDDSSLGANTISKADGLQTEFAISVIDMGDLNGDNLDDFAAIEQKSGGGTYSDVYIYYGSSSPSWSASSPDVLIDMTFDYDDDGSDEYGNFKSKVIVNVGDINGDNENDIAIVSPTTLYKTTDLTRGSGAVFIHTDLKDNPVRDSYLDASIVLNNPLSDGAASTFGQSFAAGDLNGDGNTDFAVGGKAIGASNEGGVYLYYGPFDGVYESAQGKIEGMEAGLQFGFCTEIYSDNGSVDILSSGPIEDSGTSRNAKLFVLDASSITVDPGE